MTDPVPTPLSRLTGFLLKYRLALLAAAAVLTAAAWPVADQLKFERSIESLFAEDNPHLQELRRSRELFGGSEYILVAWREPDLFRPDSLELTEQSKRRIQRLSEQFGRVPGVKADSVQNLAEALEFPYRRKRVRELVEGVLVGPENRTTGIVLELMDVDRAPVPRDRTIRRIQEIARNHDPRAYAVGEPVQTQTMFRIVERDGRVLFWWSLGLLAVVVLLIFRSLRWVLLPVAVVVATILWTRAILALSGMKLSMVSSMLNSLVTIIGVATVMHVTVRYRALRRENDRTVALRQALTELLPAVFWTCATTAVGFAALLSSRISPVQSFGVMMTVGTLLVLATTSAILPGGILLGRMHLDSSGPPTAGRLASLLNRVTHWIEHHPRLLGGAALLIAVVSGLGLFRLRVQTDMIKNLRPSSPIVQAVAFVENNLGGAGSWELNFPAPAELDQQYLDRVRSVSGKLRSIKRDGRRPITKVVALPDGLKLVPEIPFVLDTLEKRLNVLRGSQPGFIASLYNPDQGRMRIMLRSYDRQSAEDKRKLIERAERIARAEFPDATATGMFVLTSHVIQSLLRDQLVSFVLAAAGIGGMMMIAFRSVRLGLISLIPNVFPIALVVGATGWIGLPVNIATAMIASVSMGLTIDSSIHYILAWRRARREGRGLFDAFRETHQHVGRALIFTNAALIVGFSALTQSEFLPLVHFGILVSVAMLGGLAGNLVLLPVLLRWIAEE